MSRAALVVGVNFYDHFNNLRGCVNDANRIAELLSFHENGERNFEVKKICGDFKPNEVISYELLDEIKELFSNRHNEVALFYFSGHGGITPQNGGFLATSDTDDISTGISMAELIEIINDSPVKNKIIVMDTCHSGEMGNHPTFPRSGSCIDEGVTILTASSKEQESIEEGESLYSKHGVFTRLLIDALEGGASSILGQITPGSIYSHIDKALGSFGQRPIFKTNTNRFIELRKVSASIDIRELREISRIFRNSSDILQLDQSYESDINVPDEYKPKTPCNTENNRIFKILQNLNRVNIVVPVEAEHMYYAAMNEKACKLTSLGKFYWDLSKNDKL